ncbi:3',5'-cyclic AMP phosphodiesterase CpdA [Enhydrobacter aerosaccus]|uniref:3',5'-cyclic AMP phosphodiesterase CpdA n=1 Tax=Enhydrobacter aerosaccus TaxID=225324 RepID=A0A1T4SW70_9HYPH|nr:metallophosphoesterase [Enhydrobacter aerosaccus]SKA32409.1 3',5'-cyclic AMP phosphodiesterase CpdA [Enhydrobacter aerosaccus]
MFTLAHLSDPHLPMPRAPLGQLLNKRATGYYNWWRHRVHVHVPEALAGIVADIKARAPDHIALTGDLVNVALPQEFRRAADWLAGFEPPDRLTIVPGNHDVYVSVPWDESLGLWGAYMAGDGESSAPGLDAFPIVRRRGPVVLIGLSTGVPKPPFFATGDLGSSQIARAERLLAETGREGLCRIVLIHHPPLFGQSRFKRLTDTAAFQAMIRRVGCEAVLHGHNHLSEIARIAGPTGPVPVLGVTSASAAPDSKYGRARYHLIRIDRHEGGWRLDVELRALSADGRGCEPDGKLVFQSGAHASTVN